MTHVGIAIAVPAPYGDVLREKRAAFGDPQAATVPSHVTLLPPDDVGEADLHQLRRALAAVAATTACFEMSLRGTGTFCPVSPVVYVAVEGGGDETTRLAGRLRAAVVAPPAEFPFHPHVTVAQHLDDDTLALARTELADFGCRFTVREFCLYLLHESTGWQPHERFALGGGAS